MATKATSRRFCAFISYRQTPRDRWWAYWIARAIETYRTPKYLVRERGIPARPGRVFRDEDELATQALGPTIEDALERSAFLIVVCSPATPASPWVSEEISYFAKAGRLHCVLPLLVEGTPEESFPSALKPLPSDAERPRDAHAAEWHQMLAADVRPRAGESTWRIRRLARLRILARLLGCEFDELRQREQERTQRRLAGAVAGALAAAAVMAALTVWALFNQSLAERRAAEVSERLGDRRAFEAVELWDEDPTRALLLSEGAFMAVPAKSASRQTYALMTAHLAKGMPVRVINFGTELHAAGASRDLVAYAIAARGGPQVHFADRDDVVVLRETDGLTLYDGFEFNADRSLVAALGRNGTEPTVMRRVFVWNVSDGTLRTGVDLADFGLNANVRLAGFSNGGKSIVVGAPEATRFRSAIFDATSGRQIGEPMDVPIAARFGAWDWDLTLGLRVREDATGSVITVIDLDTGTPASSMFSLPGTIRRVLVSSSAKKLLTVSSATPGAMTLHVFDLRTGAARLGTPIAWGPHDAQPWAITPGGEYAIAFTGDDRNRAERWDLRDGTRVSIPLKPADPDQMYVRPGQRIRPLWFSSDGRQLFSLQDTQDHRRKVVHAFDSLSLSLLGPPTVFPHDGNSFSVSADGRRVFVFAFSGIGRVYDLTASRLPVPLRLPIDDLLYRASFLATDDAVMTVERVRQRDEYRKRLTVYSIETGTVLFRPPLSFPLNARFAAAADGGRILGWWLDESAKGIVAVWDLAGREVWRQAIAMVPHDACLFGDSLTVLTEDGGKATLLRYVNRSSQPVVSTLPIDLSVYDHTSLSRDGGAVIVGMKNELQAWNAVNGERVGPRLTFSDRVGVDYSLALDALAQSADLTARVDGAIAGRMGGLRPIRVEASSDGTNIVDGLTRQPLFANDEYRLRRTPPLRGAALISPDGRWFVRSSNEDDLTRASFVRIHEVGSGRPITSRLLHTYEVPPWPRRLNALSESFDPVLDARFIKNGRYLVTVSTHGVVRRWYIGADDDQLPALMSSGHIGAALTSHRLDGERGIRPLTRQEYESLKTRCGKELIAIAREPFDAVGSKNAGCAVDTTSQTSNGPTSNRR